MPQYPQNFSCAEKKWNTEKKNKFLAAVWTNLVHNTDSCFNISINKSYVWLNLKNMFQKNFRKMCSDSFYLDTKVLFKQAFSKKFLYKSLKTLIETVIQWQSCSLLLQSWVSLMQIPWYSDKKSLISFHARVCLSENVSFQISKT